MLLFMQKYHKINRLVNFGLFMVGYILSTNLFCIFKSLLVTQTTIYKWILSPCLLKFDKFQIY